MDFHDKLKKELHNLFSCHTRSLISEELRSHIDLMVYLLNSLPSDEISVAGNLYNILSLKEWKKIICNIEGFTFKIRTCSSGKIVCRISPDIHITLEEKTEKHRIILNIPDRGKVSFLLSPVESPGSVSILLFPSSFLAFLYLNKGITVFFGSTQGISHKIILSIYLNSSTNLLLMKKSKTLKDLSCFLSALYKNEDKSFDKTETNTALMEKTPGEESSSENTITINQVDLISVEVGLNLLTLIDPRLDPPPLLNALTLFRKNFFEIFGFNLPGVRFRDNLTLRHNQYIIKIKDNTVASGEIIKDRLLALGLENDLIDLTGPAYGPDEVYGLKGVWIERTSREIAERQGCLLMEPAEVISTHIEETFSNNLENFMILQVTELLLENFMAIDPEKVSVIKYNLGMAKINRIFKYMVSEWLPLTEPEFIIQNIYELSQKEKHPGKIYEGLRKRFIPSILHKTNLDISDCFTVSGKTEAILLKFSKKINTGYSINMPFSIKETFFKAAIKLIYRDNIKSGAVIFCSSQVRPLLLLVLRENFPGIKIFSYDEIPDTFAVKFHGEFNI
jgi:flagellar biosynthesis component FlhA